MSETGQTTLATFPPPMAGGGGGGGGSSGGGGASSGCVRAQRRSRALERPSLARFRSARHRAAVPAKSCCLRRPRRRTAFRRPGADDLPDPAPPQEQARVRAPASAKTAPRGGDRGGDRGYDRRDDRRGGACPLHFSPALFMRSAAISRWVDVNALDRVRGSTTTTPFGLESIKAHLKCLPGPRRGRSALACPRVDPRGKP